MKFKDYMYHEGLFNNAFSFVKTKLLQLFSKFKQFVLKSIKIEKASVSFTFPNFNQNYNEGYYQDTVNDLLAKLNRSAPEGYDPRSKKQAKRLSAKLAKDLGKVEPLNRVRELLAKLQKPEPEDLENMSFSKIKQYIRDLEIEDMTPSENYNEVAIFAGLVFEVECYLAIKAKGYPDLEETTLPKNYQKHMKITARFYDEIKKSAMELADLIIEEAKKVMPCIDAVIFSGGAYSIAHATSRQDPADIKLVCREQYIGYSIKYKSPHSKEKQNFNLAELKKDPLSTFGRPISNSQDFADLLNKMISEGHNTYVAIGGKTQMLHNLLSKDFDQNPENPSKYVPKDNSPVSIKESPSTRIIQYRSTIIHIALFKRGNISSYRVRLRIKD